MNHNSEASSFPKKEPSSPFFLSPTGCSAPEADHNSLWASQSGSKLCALLLRSATEPSHYYYRAPCLAQPPSLHSFYFHSLSPFLPLTSVCVESLLLSQSERMSPATLYARKNLSKRIPYGQPLLSPFLTALTHLWPGIGDVGDSTLPTAVGNNGILEYIWDTGSHQPAHSQSLRLGNQGISGDSRLYFAPFRLTRFGLWFRMETSSISRSRRCSIMRNCKSKFLSL